MPDELIELLESVEKEHKMFNVPLLAPFVPHVLIYLIISDGDDLPGLAGLQRPTLYLQELKTTQVLRARMFPLKP
jgi:hypothetical protein